MLATIRTAVPDTPLSVRRITALSPHMFLVVTELVSESIRAWCARERARKRESEREKERARERERESESERKRARERERERERERRRERERELYIICFRSDSEAFVISNTAAESGRKGLWLSRKGEESHDVSMLSLPTLIHGGCVGL